MIYFSIAWERFKFLSKSSVLYFAKFTIGIQCIFDLYIFNKKIGKISINRNFSDDSVDDLDGTLVFKENEKWTS